MTRWHEATLPRRAKHPTAGFVAAHFNSICGAERVPELGVGTISNRSG